MESAAAASPPGSPTGRGVPGAGSLLPAASPASPLTSGPAFPTTVGGATTALPSAALTTTATGGTAALNTATGNTTGNLQSNGTGGLNGMGTDPYSSTGMGMGGMGMDPYSSGMYGGYGGMGGMGGMYGGMGGMYGGMGGMGMMGMGMPGMMGMGMYGMTPDAQRGQMMMMMISSMVQLWGMFSQVVQGTFGSIIQFVGNYVGINQRLGQIQEEGMAQEEQFFHREYETRQSLLELPECDRVSTKHERAHRHRRRQKPPTSTARSIALRLLRHLVLIVVAYFVTTRLTRLWTSKAAKPIRA